MGFRGLRSLRSQVAKLAQIFAGGPSRGCDHNPREPLMLIVQPGEPEPIPPAPCPVCHWPRTVLIMPDNGRGDAGPPAEPVANPTQKATEGTIKESEER